MVNPWPPNNMMSPEGEKREEPPISCEDGSPHLSVPMGRFQTPLAYSDSENTINYVNSDIQESSPDLFTRDMTSLNYRKCAGVLRKLAVRDLALDR